MITEAAVRDALGGVTDPEYPVSIIDLGMVYGIAVDEMDVGIELTFTSIGCPAMEEIMTEVRQVVGGLPGVRDVKVQVVWSPPWTRERITERGRRALACCGVVA
jgi:metal-sulfur cluster biosynthetic enzyme